MSLSRAFTTKRSRADKPTSPGRSASTTKHGRVQISAPINLISSTNVLAFEAPDIVGTVPTPLAEGVPSVASSVGSSRDSSEHSDGGSSGFRSRGSSTDASSVDEPNHLSCYFKPSVYTDSNDYSRSSNASSGAQSFDAPSVPQRAPSHSKKAHMHVSRQRSISRLQTPPSTAHEFRESTDFFRPEPSHPFGKELEQLSEVVEEFGGVVRDAEADAEVAFMETRNLGRFCANDYMMEIGDLLNTVFEDEQAQAGFF